MSNSMSLDDFLGHKSTDMGGGRDRFLRRWNKDNPPQIDTWLNLRSRITALWQHGFPRIVTRDVDGKPRREVWSGSYNCLESEETLRKQHQRDRDTDERKLPPEVCPMCRFIEHVRDHIRAGRLSIVDQLFKIQGSEKIELIHAGGIYNGFQDDKLTDKQKAEVKAAKIFGKDAWKENMLPKCNYLFVVVDHAKPNEGSKIAIVTTLLGDKIKAEISRAMTSQGQEAGNPFLHPYCIRWVHHPNAKQFNDRYSAIKMDLIKITADVEKSIKMAPPSIDDQVQPMNVATVRAQMEQWYCGPAKLIDWDYVFGPSEALASTSAAAADQEPADEPTDAGEAQSASSADEDCECDTCGKVVKLSDPACPHCGHVYDQEAFDKLKAEEAAAAAPPAPQPARPRSRAAAAKPAPEPPPGDDDIPF